MPTVRESSAPRGLQRARAPQARTLTATVGRASVGLLVLGSSVALTGCEYSYDDGLPRSAPPSTAAPATPEPDITYDPLRREPVPPDGLADWVARTLPNASQPVAYAGAGVLAPGEVLKEDTPVLAAGTYALALACRSLRRVVFTFRTDAMDLADLAQRCGINRESIVYLASDTAVHVTVEAGSAANYAYRFRRFP